MDNGWRFHVRYFLEQDPILARLHDNIEFQRMKAEIDADMAEQLTRVRERGLLSEWQDKTGLIADK